MDKEQKSIDTSKPDNCQVSQPGGGYINPAEGNSEYDLQKVLKPEILDL